MKFKHYRLTSLVSFLLLALVMLLNCNSDDGGEAGPWQACPDYSAFVKNVENGKNAQCAWVSVPLDYEGANNETIDIFTYRYRGASEQKKGQVWLFEGGPGGSGLLLASTLRYMASQYPDYDFYSMDHRGVANSTRLGCPNDTEIIGFDPKAYDACITQMQTEWGDRLRYFSTTNAARDIHRVTNMFREKNRKVFLYAVSYGTYWLQRYLQMYPDDADGIILDSICSPTECYLDRYDGWNNTVGEQFLDFCESDPVCSAKMATLSDSPLQAVRQTFEKLDAEPLKSTGGDAIQEILSEISSNRIQAAKKLRSYLGSGGNSHQFVDASRKVLFQKGRDAHDYKFSSAVLEDYIHISRQWRDEFLAMSVFNLKGSGHPDNTLNNRIKASLS